LEYSELYKEYRQLFKNDYQKAIKSYLRYETAVGMISSKVSDLEHAFSHVAQSFQRESPEDREYHFNRAKVRFHVIAIDLLEAVIENMLVDIDKKLSLYYDYKILSYIFFIDEPQGIHELNEIKILLGEARGLKANPKDFEECYQKFETLFEKVRNLHLIIKPPSIRARLFQIIVLLVAFILGLFIDLIKDLF